MWKLHRHYLKEVAVTSTLTVLVLFGITLISLVYRGIERAQGFGLLAAAKTTLYWAADAIPHLLTISLLFATVLCFARASQDREITAVRSAGISPRVVMVPALLIGVLFSLAGSWALHDVIPAAHFHKYRVVSEGLRQLMEENGFDDDKVSLSDGDLVLTWESRTADGRWQDVLVRVRRLDLFQEKVPGLVGLFRADEAWMSHDESGEVITLSLSNLRDPIRGLQLYDALRLSIDLRQLIDRERHENEKDMASDQLLAEVYRGVGAQAGPALYHVNRRSCFALMPCLLAPIGFCIGVLARDRGRMLALVFSLVPLFLFYLSDFIGAKLVRAFDSAVFAWTPAAVTVLLGTPFCWRLLRL